MAASRLQVPLPDYAGEVGADDDRPPHRLELEIPIQQRGHIGDGGETEIFVDKPHHLFPLAAAHRFSRNVCECQFHERPLVVDA